MLMAVHETFHNVNRLSGHRSGALLLENLSAKAMAEIKGPRVRDWLRQNGFTAGRQLDRAYLQKDGTLVGLLSDNDILFLREGEEGAADESRLPLFGMGKMPQDGVYPLPRFQSSCWFRLSGASAAEAASKLCGVDLRPHRFADLQIAKTLVAETPFFIIRQDTDVLSYHLIGDLSYTSYLWPVFIEAMKEFA